MEAMEKHADTPNEKQKSAQRLKNRISFSAKIPNDVHGAFAHSLCAVRYSDNPFVDIRNSILEMIDNVGVHDWDEMEELVYCYIALNSPELHGIICQAFLSVCLDLSL
ncbi:hypothetical protein RIF29_17061 [Crotalaria pallida]|uniref:Transcription repressor n=1 Tax=Crotalaria pallida TaxID=3830 RepID=A0AAN9IEZ9_CROPI